MADGDLIAANGDQYAYGYPAEGSGQSFWFGNLGGHCWRKYVAIDGATGAVDGVYCNTAGAESVNVETTVTTSANVRLWGEDTVDGGQPSTALENNQIGAAITTDSGVAINDPYEWTKAEATAATGALTVIFTVYYEHGRP